MNKIKLPSMVEYLDLIELKLKNAKIDTEYQLLSDVLRVKDFVKQQPNISMFVPAVFEDGEWRILEQCDEVCACECDKIKEYRTALDNVIFEGFEVCEDVIEFPNSIEELFYFTENKWWLNEKFKTLEDLTKYNLTITPKFAKEFGLI
jgi:hypothetical protein